MASSNIPPGFDPNNPYQVAQLQIDLQKSCRAIIPGVDNSYHYVPSLAAGIVFLVLFFLSMSLHIVQSIWKRTWWTLVLAVGCLSRWFFFFFFVVRELNLKKKKKKK